MGRWVIALLVLLAAASLAGAKDLPLLDGPHDQSCDNLTDPLPVSGFAPVSVEEQKDATTGPFNCYALYAKPSFGYHGEILVTLSDGFNTAVFHANYDAAGATGEQLLEVSHPDLLPGILTLRGESRAHDAFALGTWEGDVQFGIAT